jgi:hypothetical protein
VRGRGLRLEAVSAALPAVASTDSQDRFLAFAAPGREMNARSRCAEESRRVATGKARGICGGAVSDRGHVGVDPEKIGQDRATVRILSRRSIKPKFEVKKRR